ncbi:MAG: hypothetical protein ABR600_12080 [Actinomycetota bacterium]
MPPRPLRRLFAVAILVPLAACGSGGGQSPTASPAESSGGSSGPPPHGHTSSAPLPTEQPVPAESNPPGDIPDSTVFVPFRADGGHIVLRVPEGWARRTSGSSVTFSDKLNAVSLSWRRVSSEPTERSARSIDVQDLRGTERAFRLHDVLTCAPSCSIPYSTAPIDVRLSVPRAIVITYDANSTPNAVTGKEYRLEVLRFELWKSGVEAVVTLSGPVGSDNVDPWRLVAESFRWT